jgi:hypothetical protein
MNGGMEKAPRPTQVRGGSDGGFISVPFVPFLFSPCIRSSFAFDLSFDFHICQRG